jgi:hypothetical protein
VSAALEAGEIVLPAIADDLPSIQAFPVEGGAVPGLGIVGDGRGLRILVLTVEEARIHDFLHDAYEAPSLSLFLRRHLLPQLIEIWALIDACSLVVHGKLPGRADRPLVITRDMLDEIDPYAEGGLILAMQIWASISELAVRLGPQASSAAVLTVCARVAHRSWLEPGAWPRAA